MYNGFVTHNRFNVAEIGAMSRDIPHEAKILVKRMRSDPQVDMQQHWKLVTILIGPNDFCLDFCYLAYPEKSTENHRRQLIETLRIIRDNIPRTIVNLVTPPSKCNIEIGFELVCVCVCSKVFTNLFSSD